MVVLTFKELLFQKAWLHFHKKDSIIQDQVCFLISPKFFSMVIDQEAKAEKGDGISLQVLTMQMCCIPKK